MPSMHYAARRNIARERIIDRQCARLDLRAIVRRIAAAKLTTSKPTPTR